MDRPNVIIVGAGIGGLMLALELQEAGMPCVILEAVPEWRELGVGINLLPHATRSLARLGLLEALGAVAVTTRESVFYTRHGQLVYREPWPGCRVRVAAVLHPPRRPPAGTHRRGA